jgi:hypothetical protein
LSHLYLVERGIAIQTWLVQRPARTSVAPPYMVQNSSVRGKSLAFTAKTCRDFTGSRISARSQRVWQGRESDSRRWDQGGKGLMGPHWEITGHIIGHGTRQKVREERRKPSLSSTVDRFPRKSGQPLTYILISWNVFVIFIQIRNCNDDDLNGCPTGFNMSWSRVIGIRPVIATMLLADALCAARVS